MENQAKTFKFYQYSSNSFTASESYVIEEFPLTMTVNGEDWLTFMCTPGELEALAVGFLYNENIIDSVEEIESVQLCSTGEIVDIWLTRSIEKPSNWRRISGCTGGISIVKNEELVDQINPNRNKNLHIVPENIFNLVNQLFSAQKLYRKAGGIHTSALCDLGNVLVSMEDIGRHNTIDKIAGFCLLNDIQMNKPIIVTTGRVSSEMLQKSNRIGVSIIISRTSPTSLSIQLAELFGITLIGYARRNQFRLYSHPDRIKNNISVH